MQRVTRRIMLALVLGCMALSPVRSLAQEAKEPAPSPTLEETFRWLKEKIEAHAGHTTESQASKIFYSYKVTKAEGTTLTFVRTMQHSIFGEKPSISDFTSTVNLAKASVAEKPNQGNAPLDQKMTKIYTVVIVADVQLEVTRKDQPPIRKTLSSAQIEFTDEDMANRVVKALQHAVKLAKTQKEPF